MSRAQALLLRRHQSENVYSFARAGRVRWKVLLGIAAVGALGGGALWKYAPAGWQVATTQPLTGQAVVEKFVHELIERGDIKSSNNVEVRSEVQLRGGGGIAILEIVPEGTFVEEGDFLVRLDDSSLQNDLTLQTIDCNSSQANVIQAQTNVETAKLALSEYESGTFKQQEEQLQSEVFIAEENFRRAEEYVRYSERLAAKGYVTPIQLEADRFAVEKASKELDVSRTKLEVLRHFTKQKTMKQLESDVKTAEARLQAALETHSVETARLNRIKDQIANCLIVAPKAGQVVYANDQNGQPVEGVLIEEGKLVRERQIIIRLPNPKQMQILAKINESRIDLVRPGMKAKVRVDALPGLVLDGVVKKVSDYPMQQQSQFTAHIKEYATEIEIVDPPAGLRPGMTAQAAIVAEERESAVQVPLQAVMEKDSRYYCLVQTENGIEPKQVQVGPTNDKFVVIEAGLSGGEQVVMTPKQFVDDLTLPEPVDYPSRRQVVLAARAQAEKEAAASQIAQSPIAGDNDGSRPEQRRPIKRSKASLLNSGVSGAGL